MDDVLKAEAIEDTNFLGWWYCCMPLSLDLRNNLSLPLFVQRDDIEHNLRMNTHPKLTLNGICLWHESFERKWSGAKIYYTLRNDWILLTLHSAKFNRRFALQQLFWHVKYYCLTYRYKEADLVLDACLDYRKGFHWLARINPETFNQHVMENAYKAQPIEDLLVPFDQSVFEAGSHYKESISRRILRKLTLNGYLFPAKGFAIVPIESPHISNFFCVKQAMNYDQYTKKGFLVSKSYKELFRILGRLLFVSAGLLLSFGQVVREYKRLAPKVVTEGFWRHYLQLEEGGKRT